MTFDEQLRSLKRTQWITIACIVFLLIWIEIRVRAQDIGKAIPTAAEAVGWALGDVATLAEIDRPWQRYVWVPPWGNEKWIAAVNFAVNSAASRANVIQLGTPVANGWMIRYDLRRLAPKVEQLNKLLAVWDGLALQDPYFHVPQLNSKIAAAVLAPHLREQEAVALAGLSLSTGAIYRADFLIYKMLSTLEGGKYYDFLQIQREVEQGKNAQAVWLATLGVFEGTTSALNADQRAGIIRSRVTGKPRRIDAVPAIGRGGNVATITRDLADEDFEPGQHPFRSLLELQDRAREIIAIQPNGLQAYALFNNQGQLQDFVPDNIAVDTTIPSPHTKRLQPSISCIRCHAEGDGYQPFENEVAKMLSSQLDVFSDLVTKDRTREEVVDILAGLYSGVLDGIGDSPVSIARRKYGAAVYKITGGVFGPEVPSIVAALHNQTGQIYASLRYDIVTPARACTELGLLVDEADGIKGLDIVLGKKTPSSVVYLSEGMLRAGISINRSDFDHDYADMALESERLRKEWKK